jgi:RNA polymerase sigma-70 factor, ECF subfamily
MAVNQESPIGILPEDAELVRAVLAGDRSAYGTLYDRYVRLIEAVCFDWTRDVGEAQDLCQDIFLLGFQRLGALNRPDRYAPWMLGVARRICRDWRRACRREKARIERIADRQRPAATPSGDCDGEADDARRLHEAILRLPGRERLAVQGFYLLDDPASRIQAILGLSRSGLYRLLERARARLQRLLQESGRSSRG